MPQVLTLLSLAASAAWGENWPCWRGPRLDGTSLETNASINLTVLGLAGGADLLLHLGAVAFNGLAAHVQVRHRELAQDGGGKP